MKNNSLLLIAMIIISSVPVLAWDRAECEAVNWNHPDCDWGRPPTVEKSFHTSSSEAGSYTKRAWIWTGSNTNTGELCSYYNYALITPAKKHGDKPTIVQFPERKKKLCGNELFRTQPLYGVWFNG